MNEQDIKAPWQIDKANIQVPVKGHGGKKEESRLIHCRAYREQLSNFLKNIPAARSRLWPWTFKMFRVASTADA